MLVATANVEHHLPQARAHEAVRLVLDHRPDLIGLQEWHLPRVPSLRRFGSLVVPPLGRLRLPGDDPTYAWTGLPVGGCAVGVRTDRFEQQEAHAVLLSPPGFADKPDRPLGLEPPRYAAVAVLRDRRTGRTVTMISYHLVPGVQSLGVYRADRPRLVARHRREQARLQRLLDGHRARGRDVYAVGDANFDGFTLDGLTSCWDGHPEGGGTLGRRRIDDVFGPGPASDVRLLTTPSDHRAVLAERPDPGAAPGAGPAPDRDFGPTDPLR
jgi:hypothetical protein